MDISINARVSCSDGPCGQSTRVILKPTTEEITDLVVASNESFPETEYMVSIDRVQGSTPSLIRLNCSRKDLANMTVFNRVLFTPSGWTGYPGSPFMLWPLYPDAGAHLPMAKDHLPGNEVVIQHGARVEAVDGYIGQVDEFLIEAANGRITQLVMREGHLWGQKDVFIPVVHIDHYQGNTFYLNLNKQAIENIPGIPLRRSRPKVD